MPARQCRYSSSPWQAGNPACRGKLSSDRCKEVSIMSDYRDPNDRLYGSSGYEPADRRNSSWGWIAGALFLVIVLALAFGVGHEPSRVASNDASQSAQNH